jgi:Ca-activated chloride channel family protein
MSGDGYAQLKSAMEYILTEEQASNDLLQFSEKDKITVIPFNGAVIDTWSTNDGTKTASLLNNINTLSPTGSTAIYDTAISALKELKNEDRDTYNLSIILMTDGMSNVGTYSQLASYYNSLKMDIPIYSIMFGSASETELLNIANLTNAKVFDGRTDLLQAFKEVRGYN